MLIRYVRNSTSCTQGSCRYTLNTPRAYCPTIRLALVLAAVLFSNGIRSQSKIDTGVVHPDKGAGYESNLASNQSATGATGSGGAEEVVSDEVRWKRAIDRDDIDTLIGLLGQVDTRLTNDKGKTALMSAVKSGHHDLMQTLLQQGHSLDDRSFTGGTSLMYAALGRQQQMISFLLNSNRDSKKLKLFVDAKSTNGWTAVMIAAAKGFDQVVKQLVVEGDADPWQADAYQWTPLMRAIDNRHTEVVRYLLSLDRMALDRVNENGATALHVAVEKGDRTSVSLLLDSKISVGIRDNENRTARDIALNRDDDAMVRLLERVDHP